MISIEMEKEIVYIKGKRLKAEVSEREKSRKGAKNARAKARDTVTSDEVN